MCATSNQMKEMVAVKEYHVVEQISISIYLDFTDIIKIYSWIFLYEYRYIEN